MPDRGDRLAGLFAAGWTLVMAAGYLGGQFVRLRASEPSRAAAWSDSALPALTDLYWMLLILSALYWVYHWWVRRRT
jgi:hypothetical protein